MVERGSFGRFVVGVVGITSSISDVLSSHTSGAFELKVDLL